MNVDCNERGGAEPIIASINIPKDQLNTLKGNRELSEPGRAYPQKTVGGQCDLLGIPNKKVAYEMEGSSRYYDFMKSVLLRVILRDNTLFIFDALFF